MGVIMAMSAAGAILPNPWEAVGRGTEVGRALFALYNGYGVARNRGNKYSDCNRMKIMERISPQGLPDLYLITPDLAPKQKKPLVKVPRFHKKHMTINDIPKVLLMRGRRKGSQILTQLKAEVSKKDQPPALKKPLLDEKEKARLQDIFEWSGRDIDDDEAASEVSVEVRKAPPARGSVEEQEMLIEAIAKEVEDRKLFLDRMFELGRGPKYEPIIQLEIQERVQQMEVLDKTITCTDKERLKGMSHQSTIYSNRTRSVGKEENSNSAKSGRQWPLSTNREGKKTEFEQHLESVRRENMEGKKEDELPKIEDDDSCAELEREGAGSEQSFSQKNMTLTNRAGDRNKAEHLPSIIVDGKGSKSLRSLDQFDSARSMTGKGPGSLRASNHSKSLSTASPHSSKCSSMQSGSICSSLKSFETSSRI